MTGSDPQQLPDVEATGDRAPGHDRIAVLNGWWDVDKVNYLVGRSPDEPARGRGLVCRRRWLDGAGRRFVEDTTTGEFGGQPYFRHGLLGYLILADRYEWTTVDGVNSAMMTFKGVPGTGGAEIIDMSGEIVDEIGFFGEGSRGQTLGQRTTITIESDDRHVLDIFLTPPGGEEVLFDRGVYTRRS